MGTFYIRTAYYVRLNLETLISITNLLNTKVVYLGRDNSLLHSYFTRALIIGNNYYTVLIDYSNNFNTYLHGVRAYGILFIGELLLKNWSLHQISMHIAHLVGSLSFSQEKKLQGA